MDDYSNRGMPEDVGLGCLARTDGVPFEGIGTRRPACPSPGREHEWAVNVPGGGYWHFPNRNVLGGGFKKLGTEAKAAILLQQHRDIRDQYDEFLRACAGKNWSGAVGSRVGHLHRCPGPRGNGKLASAALPRPARLGSPVAAETRSPTSVGESTEGESAAQTILALRKRVAELEAWKEAHSSSMSAAAPAAPAALRTGGLGAWTPKDWQTWSKHGTRMDFHPNFGGR